MGLLYTSALILGLLSGLGATLTLPGIAGLVLTLGAAVDGNVLSFERIKEELRAGKKLRQAIPEGFRASVSALSGDTALTNGQVAVLGTVTGTIHLEDDPV